MKISDLIEARQFKHSMADYDEVPTDDPGVRRDLGMIGPHEEKYLNLMLAGKKPAAVLHRKDIVGRFKPHIKSKEIVLVGRTPAFKFGTLYLVTLPGEEWRGRQLIQMFNRLREAPALGNETQMLHIKIGKLLGYPNEAIRHFIQTRFR